MSRPRSSGFTKRDEGKSRLDLLPPRAIVMVGHVLARGAKIYSADNWTLCEDPSRYVAAMLRHTLAHMKHEFTDPETSLPHLASAVCSGLFALDLYLRGVQDRFVAGNYFAIVKRKTKKRGIIVKRFKKFETAWSYLVEEKLDTGTHLVKTVPANEKVGDRCPI